MVESLDRMRKLTIDFLSCCCKRSGWKWTL